MMALSLEECSSRGSGAVEEEVYRYPDDGDELGLGPYQCRRTLASFMSSEAMQLYWAVA